MPNIRFVNRGSKRGEIWLYDVVGEGFFGGMSAGQFAKELKALGQVEVINLRINSPGGSVFDGIAIYNQLKSHAARIEVDVDGVAASIASVIAMAGNEIRMAHNAQMMIHNPSGGAFGDATEMRRMADLLDQVKGTIVDTYERRTKNKAGDLAAWMEDETWMTAAQAVDRGFSDKVTEEQAVAAAYGFDFSQFKKTPAEIVARAGAGFPARDMASVATKTRSVKVL